MIRAAKYLGVAPWDLLAQPITWFHWAVAAEQAENQAEAQRQESAKRKAKARGLG